MIHSGRLSDQNHGISRQPTRQQSRALSAQHEDVAGGVGTMGAGVAGSGGSGMLMDEVKSEVRRIVPNLSEDRYKGQSGKVAVLGGCTEYTSAPYFSSVAALQVGADLSHVFCTRGAASILKTLCPDIIVHPYLMETHELSEGQLNSEARSQYLEGAAAEVESWFTRLDCLIIGPGLGRDPLLLDVAQKVLIKARAAKLPLVLDGDGLFLVAREPELVEGYSHCVLTPNLNEFRRLASTLGVSLHGPNNDRSTKLLEVMSCLKGPTLVSKGPVDAICDGKVTMMCNASGGAKRCGGQGDILVGAIATFIGWTLAFLESASKSQEVIMLPEINPMVLASYGGCLVTRTASAYAFAAKKRATVASDMLQQLGNSMEMLFAEPVYLQDQPLVAK